MENQNKKLEEIKDLISLQKSYIIGLDRKQKAAEEEAKKTKKLLWKALDDLEELEELEYNLEK